jgi:hypothetical protein
MNSHRDDKNQGAVSLTAKKLASAFAAPRRDKGCQRSVAAVLALLFVVPALAQDASPFRDLDRYAFGYAYPGSQLKDHIYEPRLFAIGDAQRDGIGTADAVRQRQEDIRRVVIAGLGGLPSADTPLNPRRIDRGRAVGAFTVDIAFWYPQPYLANLGMLIRPRDRREPFPFGQLATLWPHLIQPVGHVHFAGAAYDNLPWGMDAATRSANRVATVIEDA